jgi:Flp pilus assembly protein TadG
MGPSHSRRSRTSPRGRGDEGAALVEFALIAPLLFLLVFGIIEFGWAFYQSSDVRHGARETARLAAVNYNPDSEAGDNQAADIIGEGCDRMDDQVSASVDISHPGGTELGSRAVVTVSKPLNSITGFFDSILPEDLTDTVAIRLEQDATWNPRALPC